MHEMNDQETFDWIVEYVDAVFNELYEDPYDRTALIAALKNIQTVAEARRGEWK